MAENSKIEWTDHTFNGWSVCTPVSPGCANCYAAALSARFGWGNYKKGVPRHRFGLKNWMNPLRWNKAAADGYFVEVSRDGKFIARGDVRKLVKKGVVRGGERVVKVRPRVFCSSLSDWLDDEVPTTWRLDLFQLIRDTPNLGWLLLTKRPESWSARLHEAMGAGSKLALEWLNGTPPSNVWVGTTVEDQQRADERIPELLKIPARVRFLSCEPLLGPVDLTRVEFGPRKNHTPQSCLTPTYMGRFDAKIHWVIVGGESGTGARPMHPNWARQLRTQCAHAGVPFLFKQWGEWAPAHLGNIDEGKAERFIEEDGTDSTNWTIDRHTITTAMLVRVGKHAAGRLLDGREWNEFPST